jgi:hypothetical protein
LKINVTDVGAAPAQAVTLCGLVNAVGGAKTERSFKVELQGVFAKRLIDPKADTRIGRGVVDNAGGPGTNCSGSGSCQ